MVTYVKSHARIQLMKKCNPDLNLLCTAVQADFQTENLPQLSLFIFAWATPQKLKTYALTFF